MNTEKKSTKPWLDHRGRELSKEQLQEISKTWDLKTWKRYGDSLETQSEGKNLKTSEFRKLSEQQTKNIFSINGETSASLEMSQRITDALKVLTERQRKVIDLIFYSGMSIGEVAKELKLSRPTVSEHKKQALFKLKGVLGVSPNTVATYEGVSELEIESNAPFEDLVDVMNQDILRGDFSRRSFKKGGQP